MNLARAGAIPTTVMRLVSLPVRQPSAALMAANIAQTLLRIVSTMVLTRLLSPQDFGLAGIVTSIFFAMSMLSDLGFQAYVIRHARGDEPEFLDSVWTIHASRGVVLTLVGIALAWPATQLLGKPALLPLLIVASTTFAIDGVASLGIVTAPRTGAIVRLCALNLATAVFQIAAGIALALVLRDVWAIILAMILFSAVRTGFSYVVFGEIRHRPRADQPIASDLWRFSRLIAASSAITLVLAQTDKLVLARLLTLPEFGVYAIAANIVAAPLALAFSYCSQILYPIYSADWRAGGEAIRGSFARERGKLFVIYLFGGGGLVGGAPLLIALLYDPRYQGAALFVSILALASTMALLTRSMAEFLNAVGLTSSTLLMNVARLSWLVVAGIAGYLAVGALGLILALGFIEFPAYLVGAVRMRRLGYLQWRNEFVAFGLICLGIVVGFVVSMGGLSILPAHKSMFHPFGLHAVSARRA